MLRRSIRSRKISPIYRRLQIHSRDRPQCVKVADASAKPTWSPREMGNQVGTYTFETVHRKGNSNLVPDALSRMFENDKEGAELDVEPEKVRNNCLSTVNESCVLECISVDTDEWYNKMLSRCSDKSDVDTHPFYIRKGQLFIKFKPRPGKAHAFTYKKVVPDSWKTRVMTEGHCEPTAAHLGLAKTKERIFNVIFGPAYRKKWKNSSANVRFAYKVNRATELKIKAYTANISSPTRRSK